MPTYVSNIACDTIPIEWFESFALFEPILPSMRSLGRHIAPPDLSTLNMIAPAEGFTFIEQESKSTSFEEGYEPRIFLKQEIPTRPNSWHDFFNALVWTRLIRSKRIINQLHFRLQQSRFPKKQRLPAEDMLTQFDENGAIVIATDQIYLDLIREHRWHELFWQHRAKLAANLKVIIFGHGLYEKALRPYIGLTAKCLLFVANSGDLDSADILASNYLKERMENLAPSLLAPLPVLGIPGWWDANQNEYFYHNTEYFRPKRVAVT